MTGQRSSSLLAMSLGNDACVVLLLLTSVGCVALGNYTQSKPGILLRQLRPNLLAYQERLNPLFTAKPWLLALGCLVSDVPSDPGNVCRTSRETVTVSTRPPPEHEPTVDTEYTRPPLYQAASDATGGSDKRHAHLVNLEAHRPQNGSWVRRWNSAATGLVDRPSVNKFHKVNNRDESVLASGVEGGREVEDVIAAIRHRRLPSQDDENKKRWNGNYDTRSKDGGEKRAFVQHVHGDVANDGSLSVARVFNSDQNSRASISSLHRQLHASNATFNNSSSSSSTLAAVTFEVLPRRGRRSQTLLRPDNHQVRATYFTPGETCRTEPVMQRLQLDGCDSLSVVTQGCRGTCHSRSQPEWHFERQQVRNVQHCTCCKPYQERYVPVVFQCRGTTKERYVGTASSCACRPCSYGNVTTRTIYEY